MRNERMRRRTATKVLEAANVLLDKRGLDDLKMPRVAKESGLSWRTVYYNFPDRDSVIASLCARRQARYVQWLRKTLGRRKSPGTDWKNVFEELAIWCRANGNLLAETQAAVSRGAVVHEYALQDGEQTLVSFLEDQIRNAQSRGELRSDLDAQLLANTALVLLTSTAVNPWQTARKSGGQRHTDHLLTLFMKGAQRQRPK